jgi:hypothetical protein
MKYNTNMETVKTTPDQDIDLILAMLVASLTLTEKADLQDLLRIWDGQVNEARLASSSFFESEDNLIVSISPLEEEPRFKRLTKMMMNHTREHKGNVRFMQVYRGLKKITQSPKI